MHSGVYLDFFDFTPFTKPLENVSEKQKNAALQIWVKTIDVLQRFDDLELRIRNYAQALVAAVVGAVGLILSQTRFSLNGFTLAAIVLFAGFWVWLAFYFMDRGWYHRLLYGALRHAEYVEHRYRKVLPEIGLTGAVRKESPLSIGPWEIHSPQKIDLFYGVVALTLLILTVLFAFFARDLMGLFSWPRGGFGGLGLRPSGTSN